LLGLTCTFLTSWNSAVVVPKELSEPIQAPCQLRSLNVSLLCVDQWIISRLYKNKRQTNVSAVQTEFVKQYSGIVFRKPFKTSHNYGVKSVVADLTNRIFQLLKFQLAEYSAYFVRVPDGIYIVTSVLLNNKCNIFRATDMRQLGLMFYTLVGAPQKVETVWYSRPKSFFFRSSTLNIFSQLMTASFRLRFADLSSQVSGTHCRPPADQLLSQHAFTSCLKYQLRVLEPQRTNCNVFQCFEVHGTLSSLQPNTFPWTCLEIVAFVILSHIH
jgi:hypothetical protein